MEENSKGSINETLALMNGTSNNIVQVPIKKPLAHLPDEMLWKIFVKADDKTIGSCRSLNRSWELWLKCANFLKEHWKENKWRRPSLILGVGMPAPEGYSRWFYDFDFGTKDQVQLNLPLNINWGMYSMVGSDHGILCIRVSQAGHHSRLLIWNPLTNKREYVFDEAQKHFNYNVCGYAFGFPSDSVDYRIVHVYKRNYEDSEMNWSLYHSTKRAWSKPQKLNSIATKLGPTYVIENGVVHWIGWGGPQHSHPIRIITFDMQVNKFFEADVSKKAKGDFHALINCNDGVGFVSQTVVGIGALVQVWDLKSDNEENIWWVKKITVTGNGPMFNPTLVLSEDMLYVTETHCSYGCSNDACRTNVIISKHENQKEYPRDLLCRCWKGSVSVKTVTLHCDGLYLPDIRDPFQIN